MIYVIFCIWHLPADLLVWGKMTGLQFQAAGRPAAPSCRECQCGLKMFSSSDEEPMYAKE
jgi:hypothetical protein